MRYGLRMRFDKLDLNILAVLDIIIEERGVSSAARRLNLSQPAVTNALVDALSEFGIRHIEMPATPERIWRAMQRQ